MDCSLRTHLGSCSGAEGCQSGVCSCSWWLPNRSCSEPRNLHRETHLLQLIGPFSCCVLPTWVDLFYWHKGFWSTKVVFKSATKINPNSNMKKQLMSLSNDFTIFKRKSNICFSQISVSKDTFCYLLPLVFLRFQPCGPSGEQLVRWAQVWPLTLAVWAGYWGCSRKPKGDTVTLSKPLRFVLLIFSWSADWLLRANRWGINPLYLSSCASFIVIEMEPVVLFWILTGLHQHSANWGGVCQKQTRFPYGREHRAAFGTRPARAAMLPVET